MKYKIDGHKFEFKLLKATSIKPHPFQRDVSDSLIKRLHVSVSRGFVIPIVINRNLEVLDGQHRLQAFLETTHDPDQKVPCIVVGEEWECSPLLLNIEKSDNIKDKCTKVYRVYLWYWEHQPQTVENELLPAASFLPSLFTLAFSYKEEGLPSPSLVETITKKLDSRLDVTVDEAIMERRRRAAKIKALSDLVDQVSSEYNIKDFNLKKAIISKSTVALWGRANSLPVEFDEGITALMEQIEITDWTRFSE